jgi:predicted transglutaminase-like cysteine proteinase
LAEPPAATAAEIQTDPSWTSAGRVTRIIWTPEIQSFLEGMNRRVNMAVHQRSDEQQYGRADYWAAPLLEHTNGYGDCEDVVLEKRAALLQDGLPVGAMSIALVKTPWGDTHAVLLISTDKGDLTLDSLSPWVRSFETTGYSFLLKQKAGSTFAWERFA